MLIDRRVVFMFAAPDISILANWFYIYYLAKIQFFFRFIIFLFRTDKAASYNPARYSPNSLPRVWAIPMLCPGSDVVYCTPNRLPLQLPVAYKPGIDSKSRFKTC